MSTEQLAEEKRGPETPADKTDAPRRARRDSVSQLKTEDFVCVESGTPLREAIEQMKKDEGGCAIICEEGRVVGIFAERDLLRKVLGEQVDYDAPVKKFMSNVETLTTDASVGDAVRVMNEKGYQDIPLIKDGKLVGSISVFDIISYLAESYPKETVNLPPVPAQVMDTQEGG